MNRVNQDIEGKQVVMEGAGTEAERTVTVTGGFGADKLSRGSSIFVKDANGNSFKMDGMEVERVIGDDQTKTEPFKKCFLKVKPPGAKTFKFQRGDGTTRQRIKASPFTFKTEAEFDKFMAEIRADNPGWTFETSDLKDN